ncbi:DinB family protein [Neobacillus sp. LXY-1]|uniref:DinB family protein n=1 Tax=Neobacillus sp. LXY-1 TaxID=3379133 RepID=UPI003EE25185
MVEKELLVRSLAEVREQLLGELEGLGFEAVNAKPSKDEWGVAQVCHHLYLAERAFTQGILYGLNKADGQKVEAKPIQALTDRSMKKQAPPIVIPSEDPMEIPQILQLLSEARTELLQVLNTLKDDSLLETKSAKHPVVGYVPIYQWVESIYLHELRHIDQIKEIKVLIHSKKK